jgi:hypothetical protein
MMSSAFLPVFKFTVLQLTKQYRVGQSIVDKIFFFFLIYRPSCLIQAYGGPEKYWLVWAGLLANHPFNFNFIFLNHGLMAVAE